MAEKQGIPKDTPPAYPDVNASPANAPYPPQPHNASAMLPPQNPGYPTTEQLQQWQGEPGYPTTGQPHAIAPPYPGPQNDTQDPKSGQPEYPAQLGYPGYQGQPGYQVQPGYPAQPGQPLYQVQPGYPVAQGAPTTMTIEQETVVSQTIPRHYACLAWFSCLCCCCFLGLIAIAKSDQARRAINEGNYPLAAQLGMEARRYAFYAIGTGITLLIVYVVIQIASSMAG